VTSAASELAAVQRRLRRFIIAPDGVAPALAEAPDTERAALEALLSDAGGIPGVRRLEVYANAYVARIEAVLADGFPALCARLGAALFRDLVTAYLIAHPPGHASIRRAGDALPGWLAGAAVAGAFRRRAPCAPDLAALEAALLDAFDAPDAPVATREALATLPPERWAGLRLGFVPSVRLLRLAWPVARLVAACERGAPLPAIEPGAADTLVWRSGERVLRRELDCVEAEVLAAAIAGEPFGALCERVADLSGESEAPARAAGWLAGWLEAGLVTGTGPED
jgi:hypothetical protein